MTTRRDVIKTTAGLAAGSASMLAADAVLATGVDVLDYDDALHALTDGETKPAGRAVELKVPDSVSNGAFVTISVRSELPEVGSIHLLIDNHPVGLVASMLPTGSAYFSLSIRIARACKVTALVQTSDGWLRKDARIDNVQIGCEV